MAKTLTDWVEQDVRWMQQQPLKLISEQLFFRDPVRPGYSDSAYFFSPADGVILYQRELGPEEPLVEIKGRCYTLRDAMRTPAYDSRSLVIGIFMTLYDVHVNRIPYSGRLSYRKLPSIETLNRPMIYVEIKLIEELLVDLNDAEFLYSNERMLNRIVSPALGRPYYVLQIADYDVNSIIPFSIGQNVPMHQTERFSQIRYGSQVDLIIPLGNGLRFTPLLETGMHVEAGVDPIVRVEPA